ncbi:MAG TPA: sigma-70 family RNA polymerase sigma factor [Solirubrobacteraceae bacterium]|nr:sigma-70 family RNA polymerase sigma factor [Solirubrobacteraceae bacterium]
MDASPIAAVPAAAPAPKSGVPIRLGVFGDERLARLVAGGSERAFATLYERYHQQLYRYCRSIVHDDADAEDVLQSALASAFAALGRDQRDAPLRPWLFRIAHNEAISLLRRRRAGAEAMEAPEQSAPSAEDRAGERARLALLVADLQELPERQRGALLMRELSGLSHDEIAIALGISVGVAKQAIFEARRALLEFAEGRSMRCEDVRRTVSDGDRRVLRGRRVRAHLSDCAPCAAFAAAIPGRRNDLQAMVPALAPVASAGILASITGGSGHGAAGGYGAAAAGAAGKTVAATLAAKALVGTAVIVTAAAGVAGVAGMQAMVGHDNHAVRSGPYAHPAGHAAGGGAGGAVSPTTPTGGAAARGPDANDAHRGTAAKRGVGTLSSISAPAAGGHATASGARHKDAAPGRAQATRPHGKPAQSVAREPSVTSKAAAHRHAKQSPPAGATARRPRASAGSHTPRTSTSPTALTGSAPRPIHTSTTAVSSSQLAQLVSPAPVLVGAR